MCCYSSIHTFVLSLSLCVWASIDKNSLKLKFVWTNFRREASTKNGTKTHKWVRIYVYLFGFVTQRIMCNYFEHKFADGTHAHACIMGADRLIHSLFFVVIYFAFQKRTIHGNCVILSWAQRMTWAISIETTSKTTRATLSLDYLLIVCACFFLLFRFHVDR